MENGILKALSLSLSVAGLGMFGFGFRENLTVIGLSGFVFFAMIPIANSGLDYLVRTNLPNELQGRAWGVIGFLSQLGYVLSYGLSGILADGISRTCEIRVGRGCAAVIMAAGILLVISAALLYGLKSVRELEHGTAGNSQETIK